MNLSNRTDKWQLFIFLLMWMTYAVTVMLRKPFGLIKSDLESGLSIPKYELGLLDTAFLLPYSGVQAFYGSIGDYYGVRKTVAACLIGSALAMCTFGQWQSIYISMLLLFMSGAFQSLVWPTTSKAIGEWFTSQQRNTVFGIYGTSSFAGGIIGTLLVVKLRETYDWQNVYQIPSGIAVLMGVFVLVTFREPGEVGIKLQEDSSNTEKTCSLSFRETLNFPVVTDIVYASFSINFVRYCVYMWLPMYLSQHLHYSTSVAGLFSLSFEIGGVFGSVTIGFVIDRFLRGRCLHGCTLYVLLSVFSLSLFHLTSAWGHTYNVLFIFLTGVFNCGVDTIMTGSVPTQLGSIDGRDAGAAISGIINGFGKISTLVQGPIIGVVAEFYGWSGVILSLLFVSIIGSILTFKASIKMEQLGRFKLVSGVVDL